MTIAVQPFVGATQISGEAHVAPNGQASGHETSSYQPAPTEDEAGDGLVAIGERRCFSYRSFGDRNGLPLIALHGTPGSRLKFVAAHATAKTLGIRVIAPDRWGYGATTAHDRPKLSTFARDIGLFADRLGLDRFAVLGVSGGGPFAAAIAAVMPERVTSLAFAAPVGPIAGEADDEISAFHRLCFGALARRPAAAGAVFKAFRVALDLSPGIGMRLAMLRIAAADQQVLGRENVAAQLGDTFIEGLRPGVVGPITDLTLFASTWDIDLSQAKVPARMWLGSVDQNIPRSAARRLAARLPNCELIELNGQGHLWIADHYDTVLEWVVAQAC